MKAEYSNYLLSRRFNRKVFDKVRAAIRQLNFDAQASITMSAKHQTPRIIVTGPQNGEAADEIHDILNEHFQVREPYYEDDNTTEIDFQDQY